MKITKLIKIFLQYLMPKFFFTKVVWWLSELEGKWLTTIFIFLFIKIYKINIKEAQFSKIRHYSTFNKFFCRKLKEGTRNFNKDINSLISPADGTILQYGNICNNLLLQAKNKNYNLQSLLAHRKSLVNLFINGYFFSIYLAPYNYHRIHMPYDALLIEMIYVPGKLMSVNKLMSENIDNLFTKNERLICIFKTEFGYMSQILVGSLLVGGICTSWQGNITPPHRKKIKYWQYSEDLKSKNSVFLFKGQEMGYFKFGSTVINLFTRNSNIIFESKIFSHTNILVGQKIATFNYKI